MIGLILLGTVAGGGVWLLDASIDPAEEASRLAPVDRAMIAGVRSWGYQLQRLDVAQVAGTPLDLVVVDETLDGHRRPASVQRTLSSLKQKPDSGRRLVLSYMSIGEAEDYRPYWRPDWVASAGPNAAAPGLSDLANLAAPPARANVRFVVPGSLQPLRGPSKSAPAWLGEENAEWRGNYRVRFWHPDWQRQMFGQKGAALDRIIAAGFDGIYLDRADVHETWRGEQPTAKADMVQFIERLAAYARQQRPGFLVVMQNAEELLALPAVRRSLDAVAKEDFLFGADVEGQPNSTKDVDATLRYLKMARGDGLPVMVVEYLADTQTAALARKQLEGLGFVPYFAPRRLNALGNAG